MKTANPGAEPMTMTTTRATAPVSLAIILCGMLLAGSSAQAETVTIPVPKSVISTAFNTALGSMKVHVDNYDGSGNGTSWLDDDSYVLTPGGSRRPFAIPEYTFDVTKWRKWKYYVNDFRTSSIQASIDGSRIQLDAFFESQGEEIKTRCIRRRNKKWGECTNTNFERDIHLNNSIAAVSLTPTAYDGSISYADPDVDFKTDVKIANRLCQRVKRICGAIEKRVDNELTGTIESTVRARLESSVVRGAVADRVRSSAPLRALIDPSWRVTNVASSGSNFLVTVQRPDTIGAGSVRSLSLAPVRSQTAAACPATVKFKAKIRMKHSVEGEGFLSYENGAQSPSFDWRARKGKTVTSTVSRKFSAPPGSTENGWTTLTVKWRGTDGRSYSKTSNKAHFSVACKRNLDGFRAGS